MVLLGGKLCRLDFTGYPSNQLSGYRLNGRLTLELCVVPDWHALFIWWLRNGSQSKDSFLLGWQITIKTLQKTDNNIKLIFRHFRVTHVWSCCWFIIILERKWRYDFLHSLQIKHFSDLNYQELKINEWSSIEVIFEICNWDPAMY